MTADISRLSELVAEIDAADSACPIRQIGFSDECQKCGANPRQCCGPVVCAEGRLVEAVRAMVAAQSKVAA